MNRRDLNAIVITSYFFKNCLVRHNDSESTHVSGKNTTSFFRVDENKQDTSMVQADMPRRLTLIDYTVLYLTSQTAVRN
jgi:hypothetical protein